MFLRIAENATQSAATVVDTRHTIAMLPGEYVFIMPLKILFCGQVGRTSRQKNLPAVKCIVLFAVLVLLVNPLADLEVVLWGDCDVSSVEQRVKVAAEEDSILDFMRAALAEWTNVGGLENGQDSLAAHRAPARVCVGDDNAE